MHASQSGHDARRVANLILKMANKTGLKLTIMQLIKLLFIAHGWSLAFLNRPLISERFQAWRYGPVAVSVYGAFPGAGSRTINQLALDTNGQEFSSDHLCPPDQLAIISDVLKGYGELHAFQLSGLTHLQGSPWQRTFEEKGIYAEIPNELIKEYFSSLNAASRNSLDEKTTA